MSLDVPYSFRGLCSVRPSRMQTQLGQRLFIFLIDVAEGLEVFRRRRGSIDPCVNLDGKEFV